MSGFKNKAIASAAGSKSSNKGQKHRRTIEWEKLGDFITDAGAKRAVKIMMESNDEDFMDHYRNLLNYFRPKMSHVVQENDPVEIKPVKIFVGDENTDATL